MRLIKGMLFAITVMAITFGASCVEKSSADYPTPQAQKETVVEEKNPIQLEKVYDYYEEENGDNSYVEMYRFDMKGMEYLHVQEDNGDGYGYVINLTKDSLMCAQLAREQPVGVRGASPASPISETNKQEDWYKN